MLLGAFSQYFFGISIFLSSIFLIMLVLVQRGRGGGLTGALGGPGGQSAFGTKAGDLFTRITIGVAVVWIVLCALSVFFLKPRGLPDFGVPDGGTTANISGNVGSDDADTGNVIGPPPEGLLDGMTGGPEAEGTTTDEPAGNDSGDNSSESETTEADGAGDDAESTEEAETDTEGN
ncbi:MAG: preprotein translocase subunit SecG [Planctomycetota bacterium]